MRREETGIFNQNIERVHAYRQRPQYVVSKMDKTNVLLEDKDIAGHIPETIPYSSQGFEDMVTRHSYVVLKPDRGRKGVGLISVRSGAQGSVVHIEKSTTKYEILKDARKTVE